MYLFRHDYLRNLITFACEIIWYVMLFTEKDFKVYFRKTYPQMAFFASRFIDAEDVEDVMQESFIALWNHLDKISDESHATAYLYRLVYNNLLNFIKHKNVVHRYSKTVLDIAMRKAEYYGEELNDVLSNIENAELRKQIDAAVALLPDKMRQVFLMSYMHDMKNKEIANVMGISVRTVEVHLYKALKILRGYLGDVILDIMILAFLHYVHFSC